MKEQLVGLKGIVIYGYRSGPDPQGSTNNPPDCRSSQTNLYSKQISLGSVGTTLSIAGGFIGIVLGIGASFLISKLAGWATSVGPGAVLLAVFFSALVGVGFGYYPARKAAYLDPIEALRYD